MLVAGGAIPLICLPFYMWLVPESVRFLVVNNYPAERIARTLRRVVGGGPEITTQFTINEQKVASKAKAAALLAPSFRTITVSLWATYFMGLMVIYLLSGWLPTLIKDAGLPIERAVNTTALSARRRRLHPDAGVGGGVHSASLPVFTLLAGFCMSGAQTGLNAFAPYCYPTLVRATGVSWMHGIGRFGSILGSAIGGVLLSMGWGFSAVIAILAVPATLAALSIVFTRFTPRAAAVQA